MMVVQTLSWTRPLLLGCVLIANSTYTLATPSSDDIVLMCERALKNGYHGRPAQMCTWYVTPCDCDAPNADVPQVCVPADIPSQKIAEQVVALLKGLPEFRDADGNRAVAKVLSVRYPCTP